MPGKISEDIFELIQSLTKVEKRYFKSYAAMGSANENNIYRRLFNAIEIQKKYNETKILKKIPEIKPGHLSSKKNYLADLILESLQWYHSHRSVNARLLSFIAKIEILHKKGLLKQCGKQIKKAKELAKHYDRSRSLLEILGWEEKILQATTSGEKRELEFNRFLDDYSSIAETIKNYTEYRILNNKVYKLHRTKGALDHKTMSRELKSIIQHPLMRETKATSFFDERFIHRHILSTYYYVLENFQKSYEFQLQNIQDYELHPHHIQDSPVRYITSLNNLMSCCALLRKEKEIENIFYKVKRMMQDTAFLNKKNIMINLTMCCSTMLNYYSKSGEFQKGTLLANQVKESVNKIGDLIDKPMLMDFYYIIAYNYFGVQNYKQTLVWINKIVNQNDAVLNHNVQVFSRLLKLIVYFEQGNERMLEHFANTTNRFLLSQNTLYKIETLVVDLICPKIRVINSMKERIVLFKNLKSKIESLAKDPFERQVFEYFDFISWLESKINGKPFAEVIKSVWQQGALNQSNSYVSNKRKAA